MNLILLGGNSPKNKNWIEEVEETLSGLFDDTEIQYFEHWEDGGSLQMDTEREKLKKMAESQGGKYAVFAKSAGVLLAVDAINDRDIDPQVCIFVGAPLGASAPERLGHFKTPTLFIQQDNDPIRPAKKLENVLKNSEAQNWQLETIPGDDHIYADFDTLRQYIHEFKKNNL